MARKSSAAVVSLVLLALGCTPLFGVLSKGHRTFHVVNGSRLDLAAAPSYYVVVNAATEEVDYGHLWDALDYSKYAAKRDFKPARPEIPTEIARYLEGRGKQVQLGPVSGAPRTRAMIVVYKELWGWDMRDIIKALAIYIYPVGRRSDAAAVKFEELTIFNTQPVASSLVPQMLDRLFASGSSHHHP